jgi:hypothetical protein
MKYRKISDLVLKIGSVICNILIGKSEGRRPLKDLCADLCVSGRIIFKWILNKQNLNMWTGFTWHQIRSRADLCEDIIEPSGSIKAVANPLII